MSFYAVAIGRVPGIYLNWDECKAQVNGHRGARFKKFPTAEEASTFCRVHANDNNRNQATSPRKMQQQSHFTTNQPAGPSQDNDQLIKSNQNWPSEGSRPVNEYRNKVVVYVHATFDFRQCAKSTWKEAQAGIGVYWPHNLRLNNCIRLEGKVTKSRAEIQAAVFALKTAKARRYSIVIRTDSHYLLNSVTSWIPKWIQNDWRKLSRSNSPVKDKEDFLELLALMHQVQVDWEEALVSSNEFNFAKQLAIQGMSKRIRI